MPTLTIRNISEEALARFRVHAAGQGRSMEAQARLLIEGVEGSFPASSFSDRVDRAQDILRQAFGGQLPGDLVDDLLADRRAAAARGE